MGLEGLLEFAILVHGVSEDVCNSNQTPTLSSFQAFCPVLRIYLALDTSLFGVDTHWFRGNSYFRIGWDWIKAAFSNRWQLLTTVILTSNQDPEPAMASRKQHQTRLYRLEFQVQKFVYNAA